MAEYIQKEPLLEHAEYDNNYRLIIPVEAIKAAPVADVAPVVHGRWNADETCSLCGEKSTEGLDATKWNYWLPNYCPTAGRRWMET